ncbi:tRNA (adenosine(37)-N6)-threonylcarbamoyltransferase complex ATPase subunit type 1 TsaE [Trichlorobacter lovleyi]|uniref:tRNA (adenosine(37)-N6)-threonylcarbamoyltransferase complex ATPase subunit type 1 TsaE n=1 Tax=Trichlorobacter lovleyi TaxID=313985 RepID=UPI0024816DFA|nr:tRNA (adenosine(37)-N6)-threonylcarbamoyltransferase complex ATPase subunit type 1 TsaE [Trichlorobacter lovleyi]
MSCPVTSLVIETSSPEQTEAVGASLGRLLEAGDLVTLSGELGGGKTCFVRGVVKTLTPAGKELVSSPTFAILNEYPGQPPVLHYDCYRLRGSDDALELGIEEQLCGDGVCLLEWPERIADILPDDRLEVLFEYAGDTRRAITFLSHGCRGSKLLEQLAAIGDSCKKPLSEEQRSAM